MKWLCEKKQFLPIIGCLLLVLSCRQDGSQPDTGGAYPTLVVGTGDKTLSVSYPAIIRGRQDIRIYSQVSGKITDVHVKEGDAVSMGQVLFVVDQIPYQAEWRVAEANYAAAKVGVESAQLTCDNAKELFDNKIVSSYEWQDALNQLHAAEAALAQAEAEKVNAANNLSYTEIKSPVNGVVGTLPYRQGTLVSPAMSEPLTTVSDNSEMYVYFSMNENNLLDLARSYGTIKKALRQMPDIQLRLSDGSMYDSTGRIESISGIINESTGSASVRAVFPNPNHLLRSGANGSIVIPKNYKDVLSVPQEATYELQDKVFVYKVVGGVTKSSQITVSPDSDGKAYIVLDGLQTGDTIIATGAGLLRDGLPVQSDSTKTVRNDTMPVIPDSIK